MPGKLSSCQHQFWRYFGIVLEWPQSLFRVFLNIFRKMAQKLLRNLMRSIRKEVSESFREYARIVPRIVLNGNANHSQKKLYLSQLEEGITFLLGHFLSKFKFFL